MAKKEVIDGAALRREWEKHRDELHPGGGAQHDSYGTNGIRCTACTWTAHIQFIEGDEIHGNSLKIRVRG